MVGLWDFDIRLADCDCQYDHAFIGGGNIGDADLVWWPFNQLAAYLAFIFKKLLTPACAVEVVVVDVVAHEAVCIWGGVVRICKHGRCVVP